MTQYEGQPRAYLALRTEFSNQREFLVEEVPALHELLHARLKLLPILRRRLAIAPLLVVRSTKTPSEGVGEKFHLDLTFSVREITIQPADGTTHFEFVVGSSGHGGERAEKRRTIILRTPFPLSGVRCSRFLPNRKTPPRSVGTSGASCKRRLFGDLPECLWG